MSEQIKTIERDNKIFIMNRASFVLREVAPNWGGEWLRVSSCCFSRSGEAGQSAERVAYLRNNLAARAASHHRVSDGRKWLGLESAISFQLNSQTLVCRPLGEFSVIV